MVEFSNSGKPTNFFSLNPVIKVVSREKVNVEDNEKYRENLNKLHKIQENEFNSGQDIYTKYGINPGHDSMQQEKDHKEGNVSEGEKAF